ncbi:MAG: M14 family zinc carboxypeptidase [Myxococcota bacterium]
MAKLRPPALVPDVVPGRLRELEEIYALIERLGADADVRVLTRVDVHGSQLPVHGLVLGTSDRSAPTLLVVGGVHGLERIGTRVVIAYLHTLTESLRWDAVLRETLERSRICLVPLVNPGGMLERTRSNPAGVDLMRNAPVSAGAQSTFLVGGHRLSPELPWYMGEGEAMEPEAEALCRFVEEEVFGSDVAIGVDCHSGFGFEDQLWFPYARTRAPFPHLPEVFAIKRLLDATLPNHVYRVEPQAKNYTVHGDLWDYLHDRYQECRPDGCFLPLTLEMGSWTWIKKNPRQAFDILGTFNPIKPHRLRRTLRRHIPLFDFLLRAAASPAAWARADTLLREERAAEAFELWYAD